MSNRLDYMVCYQLLCCGMMSLAHMLLNIYCISHLGLRNCEIELHIHLKLFIKLWNGFHIGIQHMQYGMPFILVHKI